MTYYAFIQENKINGVGQCQCLSALNIEISEEIYNGIISDSLLYIWDGEQIILNPNYEEEKKAIRKEEFEKEFFETSLGWIRRKVNMADGSIKDFLSDLLPTISMAVQMGTSVNIIAYDEPDFTEEITDWTPYQHIEVVTPQFLQECFMQLSNDFLPINTEE